MPPPRSSAPTKPSPSRAAATAPGGVRIAVHDHGGSGLAVVLAHGTGLHGRVWDPLAALLAPRFRPVSFDARGHGGSAIISAVDFDWDGFAADALAVVGSLGLIRPRALGHSSGATALLMAEQERPGTFSAIYCYEPVVVPADPPLGPDPDSWLAAAARRRRDSFPSRDEAFAHYSSKPPLSALTPAALRAYVDHGLEDLPDGTVRLKCRPEHEALVYEMATAHRCFGRLGEVACPVLVAYGDAGERGTDLVMRQVAERLPEARLCPLPGLGHLGPLEDPAAVAASFSRFVDDLEPIWEHSNLR